MAGALADWALTGLELIAELADRSWQRRRLHKAACACAPWIVAELGRCLPSERTCVYFCKQARSTTTL